MSAENEAFVRENTLRTMREKLEWLFGLGPRRFRTVEAIVGLKSVEMQVEGILLAFPYMTQGSRGEKVVLLNRQRSETDPEREGLFVPVRRLELEDVMEICWYPQIGRTIVVGGDE